MTHQEINTQNKKCHLGLKLLPNADRILGSHTKQSHNYHYTNCLSQPNKIIPKHRVRLTKGQSDVTIRLIPTKHTQQVGICHHSTGNAHINKPSGTILVILATH